MRLFLDGDLQFASTDEHRYHEALVHPAVGRAPRSVLVLGGGDGLAAREVLRHASVERVVEVELDPAVLELARTDPRMLAANDGALDDPRVEVVVDDAMRWLRTADEALRRRRRRHARPRRAGDRQALLAGVLRPGRPRAGARRAAGRAGRLAVLRARGVLVHRRDRAARPACDDDLPRRRAELRRLGLRPRRPRRRPRAVRRPGRRRATLRFLDGDVLAAATVFPRDRGRDRYDVEVSTLDRPRILEYEASGWRGY